MSKYLIIPTLNNGDVHIPANNILNLWFDGGVMVRIRYQNHKNIPPSYLGVHVLCVAGVGLTPPAEATEIVKKAILELLGSSSHTLTVPIKALDCGFSYI